MYHLHRAACDVYRHLNGLPSTHLVGGMVVAPAFAQRYLPPLLLTPQIHDIIMKLCSAKLNVDIAINMSKLAASAAYLCTFSYNSLDAIVAYLISFGHIPLYQIICFRNVSVSNKPRKTFS
jgi:hypothetical protein